MANILIPVGSFAVYDKGQFTIYTDFPTICFNTFVCPIHSNKMAVYSYKRAWSYAEIVAISKQQGWLDADGNWVVRFPLPISTAPWQ